MNEREDIYHAVETASYITAYNLLDACSDELNAICKAKFDGGMISATDVKTYITQNDDFSEMDKQTAFRRIGFLPADCYVKFN